MCRRRLRYDSNCVKLPFSERIDVWDVQEIDFVGVPHISEIHCAGGAWKREITPIGSPTPAEGATASWIVGPTRAFLRMRPLGVLWLLVFFRMILLAALAKRLCRWHAGSLGV